jgi:aerobic carbon-monoxide dehydrogenase large subunit
VSSPQELIGASPRRKEDRRLITGTGRYVDDLKRPGLLHMAVVRSRHAHARIICARLDPKGVMPKLSAVS